MTAQIVLLVNLEYRKIFCHNYTKLRAKSANKISKMNIWGRRGAFCVKQCRTNLRYPAEPCMDVQHLPHLYGVFLLPSGFLPLKVLLVRKYMSETSGKEELISFYLNTYQLVCIVYGENQQYWPGKYIFTRELLKSGPFRSWITNLKLKIHKNLSQWFRFWTGGR